MLKMWILLSWLVASSLAELLERPSPFQDLVRSSSGYNLSRLYNTQIENAPEDNNPGFVKIAMPVTNLTGSGSGKTPQTTSTPAPVPSNSVVDNQAKELVLELARKLEKRLKDIRMDEMSISEVQAMFDSMEFVPVMRSDEEQLNKTAQKLDEKMDNVLSILGQMREFIINLDQKSPQGNTVVYPCSSRHPKSPFSKTISYNRDQIEIMNNNATASLSAALASDTFSETLYQELRRVNRPNSSSAINFKRQFFLSPHDNAIDNSCPLDFDSQIFRNILASSIKNKKLLILLDHGNSLNADQLELTKSMAKNVLGLLSDTDTVNIIAISDKVTPFLPQTLAAKSGQNAFNKSCQTISSLSNNSSSSSSSNIKWKMHPATMDSKMMFHKYIDGLNKTKEHTNHSLGFKVAFEFIRDELNTASESGLIFLYISRGLLSLAEAKTVLQTIAIGQYRLLNPVVINTCAIIIDEKRIMYERQFLRDIAVQDYKKYEIQTPYLERPGFSVQGKMFSASKQQSQEIYVNATGLFSKYFIERPVIDENIILNPPYLDTENNDLIVSLTQSIGNFGIFGIDLYLQDLAEDILFYNKQPDSYAFLLNYDGIVLVHPSLINRSMNKGLQYRTDVFYLEQNQYFDHELRNRILNTPSGKSEFEDVVWNGTVSYTWKHTKNDWFIICIVTKRSYNGNHTPVQLNRISGIHSYNNHHQFNNDMFLSANLTPDVLYHRLDLMTSVMKTMKSSPNANSKKLAGISSGKVNLCRNFKQISTFDSGTLYLSPSAFQSPFLFTKSNRDSDEDISLHRIQALMAYLKDRTTLIANPGLSPQIRNDVVALSYIINHLKRKHLNEGPLKKYIIRRYVGTMNGVLQVFPGLQLDGNLEPLQRPWFIKAMTYPGKIVLTEPYLDAGGAGYIISIAYTIFEGKSNAMHNTERDTPIAVLAIDLTMGFFYKMLLEANNVCSLANIKCFLIDDKGYLVAHPNILEPVTSGSDNESRRPLEHITHRESFVANDILNHKILVQKKLCNVYPNRTTQRYYQFNTSMTEALTNIVHTEKSKYHITLVPGTNVFLTVLNSSNHGGAFCPCSTVDRLCLNCNRMEQTECECPCECPIVGFSNKRLEGDVCQRNETITKQNCNLPSLNFEEFNLNTLMPIFRYDFDEIDLKSCLNPNCDLFNTQMDCLGVIGCEWCQVDVDGETLFNHPFCTAQSSCFNGVLGSITPYGLEIVDNQLGATIFIDPLTPPTYSSIGPIAGAIIALCLVIGFAMYCYRQNQDPHQNNHFDENFYIDSTLDNNYDVPMNRMNYEDTFDDHNDGNNSNQNLLPINNGIIRPEISPYRAPSAYRRPNGDSDHGYSTMTPHDDSENLCFTLADPLLNSQKRASISDSASINTSVSSPTNFQKHYNVPLENKAMDLRDTGALLGSPTMSTSSPHHVLAPVTVHRQMEATT